MRLRRRAFVGACAAVLLRPRAPAPRRVLVLGGTRWIGPHVVRGLLARGHAPTLFNRGRTNPGLFPEVEQIRGDRDGDLSELTGRSWDTVLDLSGTRPRWVRRSSEVLAGSIDRYVLMSSTAVYAGFDAQRVDESLPLRAAPAGGEDDPGAGYGARKAACERIVAAAWPGRACSLRPPHVIGPDDPARMLDAWLARTARGGAVQLPGLPHHAILYIDVRDLAAFVVEVIERDAVGPFNVTHHASAGAWATACRLVTGAEATFVWSTDSRAPMLYPPVGPTRRWGELEAGRALASGLSLRPAAATIGDTWLALRGDASALAAAARVWHSGP